MRVHKVRVGRTVHIEPRIREMVLVRAGGAQRGRSETIDAVGKAIEAMLKDLGGKKPEALVKDRRQKYLDMGSKGLAA